jgi:GntR family transcriptional repressor for pyruvate dehydrogenase complex
MTTALRDPFLPIVRQSLSDDLVHRIRQVIQAEGYGPGARLPAITRMAKRFGVGAPTLREALKKLETVGAVEIKHGSGVYVGKTPNTLFISNPIFDGSASKRLLLDLVEARIPIEIQAAVLAARQANDEDLDEMQRLLAQAEENLENDPVLSVTNMAFHRQIAVASGNVVFPQILELLSNLFRDELRIILGIYGSRREDYNQHVGIFTSIREKDEIVAAQRMRTHLEGVRSALVRWDSKDTPLV